MAQRPTVTQMSRKFESHAFTTCDILTGIIMIMRKTEITLGKLYDMLQLSSISCTESGLLIELRKNSRVAPMMLQIYALGLRRLRKSYLPNQHLIVTIYYFAFSHVSSSMLVVTLSSYWLGVIFAFVVLDD